ncbi:MAG: GTPase-associated protein 1-related protein, partial [Actinomycetes bacterium]
GALRGPSARGASAHDKRADRIVAAALTLADRPLDPVEIDPVISWLGRPSAILTEQRRGQLFERVLASTPDIDQLRGLAEIADRLRATRFAEHIRWRLFAREMGQAANGANVAVPLEPELFDRPAATRWMEAVLARAEPAAVARVLTIAGHYRLTPDPTAFRAALEGFVRWWADDGGTLPEMAGWPCRDQVVDLLRDELAARIARTPSSFSRRVAQLWWPRLWTTIQDPRSPLDAALVRAAMAAGDDEVRESLARTVLSRLRDGGGVDDADIAWRLLSTDANMSVETILAVLRLAVTHRLLSADTAHEMARVLERQEHPTAPVLDALALLGDLGHLFSSSRPASWQRDVLTVRSAVAALRVERPDEPNFPLGTLTTLADQLATVARPVWAACAAELLRVVLPLHPG